MTRKLRKFRLADRLPRLSRAQVRVTNALLCHLAQTPFEAGFKRKLSSAIGGLLNARLEVWFEGVRSLGPGELKRVLAEPTCAAVLGLAPRTEKALLEVDLTLAQHAIDKLLGGAAEDTDGQRPLSEIEDGVFSFVLLRLIQLLQDQVGAERDVTIKLEGAYGTLQALGERFAVDEAFFCLSFRVQLDGRASFARVYLPEGLVQEAFPADIPAEGPALERWLRRLRVRSDTVRLVMAPLVAEVGRIALQLTDVEALEVDDIILVEDSEVRVQPGEGDDPGVLTGRVQCRVGDGHRGVISGTLAVGEVGRYEIQIEAITPMGEPRPRAHLFRDDLGASEDADMDSENARRMSKAGVVDAEAWAEALRRGAGSRALAGAARGVSSLGAPGAAGGDDEDPRAEHSDDHDDAREDGDEEASPEAAGLLEDISVAMVVELGRVMVSAADVVQLRAGQVIELSRAPGEPVDLVVDGKRVGKGELVEIDGELGVRILSLVK